MILVPSAAALLGWELVAEHHGQEEIEICIPQGPLHAHILMETWKMRAVDLSRHLREGGGFQRELCLPQVKAVLARHVPTISYRRSCARMLRPRAQPADVYATARNRRTPIRKSFPYRQLSSSFACGSEGRLR